MRDIVVAIDLETTGLDASTSKIIEIGAVKFRDQRILRDLKDQVPPQPTTTLSSPPPATGTTPQPAPTVDSPTAALPAEAT